VAKICIEKILKKKRLTKYAFAKMLNHSYSTTVRYYKPGFNPRLSTLERWAELLDVSVKDLIEE